MLADEHFPHHGPGRQDNGNLHLSEIQLFAGDVHGTQAAWSAASADYNQPDWGVECAIDGIEDTAWGIYPEVGRSHTAVFELKNKLHVPAGTKITVVLKQLHGGGHLIGRARLSVTDAAVPAGAATPMKPLPTPVAAILDKPRGQRTAADRVALARFQQREATLHELAALPSHRTFMPRPMSSSRTPAMCNRADCGRSNFFTAATSANRADRRARALSCVTALAALQARAS